MKPLVFYKACFNKCLLFIVLLLIANCSLFEEDSELNLKVLDVSSTEAWLKVKNADSRSLELFRDDSLVNIYNLKHSDTTIIDTGLMPLQEYSYKIKNAGQSARATATTMDTTSHNFSWQSWSFGEHSSSVLNDVVVIDENNKYTHH